MQGRSMLRPYGTAKQAEERYVAGGLATMYQRQGFVVSMLKS